MLDQQEYSSPYNIECVSVVYNNELKEHLDELDQLRDTFIEDEKTYRSNRRYVECLHTSYFHFILPYINQLKMIRSTSTEDEKVEQIQGMKKYIEEALANLAFSITHATQKVKQ